MTQIAVTSVLANGLAPLRDRKLDGIANTSKIYGQTLAHKF